ncbi:MAG: glycosyltransferase family 4 protein [Pseudomonadota bacterium]
MSDLPRLTYLTALYPAASHTFILREVTALRDLGFEVQTASLRAPDANHLIGPEEEAAFATTFYAIDHGKNPFRFLKALLAVLTAPGRFFRTLWLALKTAPPGAVGAVKQMFYLAEAIVLAQQLRDKKTDHLHNHFADPSANVAMLASELSGVPFSYTLHGPAELYEPEKWQLREKTARAAFVACISNFARSQAMYFSHPEHWQKLSIIHCGVEPERYRTSPKARGTSTDFLFVGRLTPIKGVRVLFEAFSELHRMNSDVTLTLVGDGDDRAALEALARPMGDAVRFLGFQSQSGVAQALSRADALVLPSFAEGLPVVLMEALAAEKPVICTQVGGVSELVEDGASGLIVPAGNAPSLAAAMARVADDPDLRAAMGARGRAMVEREFASRTEAARLATLFVGAGSEDLRPEPFRGAD